MWLFLHTLPILTIYFVLWISFLTRCWGFLKWGRSGVTQIFFPYCAACCNNKGHLQNKYLEPASHSHQELNPDSSKASRAASTLDDTDYAFIQRKYLSSSPSSQMYFPSPLHHMYSCIDPFNFFCAGKRRPSQNPKFFLIRQFHKLKAPDLDTSSALPLYYLSPKPLILIFHWFTRTSVLSPFAEYSDLAWPHLLLCTDSYSTKISLSWGDDMVLFRSHRLPLFPILCSCILLFLLLILDRPLWPQ